ncbi:uncharacterized protein PFL1_06375 [Pseudozyma flocculosa PF-1]|uniref:Uncharacterized protein n=2 Tax=Pseudozyma flocculosa TaxID=84751 RepID=A0A5C3FAS6_9BASI|nr:uncharacterized protein PFL1_06375 [Pseudozyma flocculosa PF-1]EPQ26168.1 hypothetical protein PFL1_06375 [Pseudozyma flocculosa PF-1]SPO40419.1 uncharacterized protein PSFLO_05901 [Pseudozyma flocculosa]
MTCGQADDLIELATASFPNQSLEQVADATDATGGDHGQGQASQASTGQRRGRSSQTKDIRLAPCTEGATRQPLGDRCKDRMHRHPDPAASLHRKTSGTWQGLDEPMPRAFHQEARWDHEKQPDGGYVEDAIASEIDLGDDTGEGRGAPPDDGSQTSGRLAFARRPSNVGIDSYHTAASCSTRVATSPWVANQRGPRGVGDPGAIGASPPIGTKDGLYAQRRAPSSIYRHGRSHSDSNFALCLGRTPAAGRPGFDKRRFATFNGASHQSISTETSSTMDQAPTPSVPSLFGAGHPGTTGGAGALGLGGRLPLTRMDNVSRPSADLRRPLYCAASPRGDARSGPSSTGKRGSGEPSPPCDDHDLPGISQQSDSMLLTAAAPSETMPCATVDASSGCNLPPASRQPSASRSSLLSINRPRSATMSALPTAPQRDGLCLLLSPVHEGSLHQLSHTLVPGPPLAETEARRLQGIRRLATFCGEPLQQEGKRAGTVVGSDQQAMDLQAGNITDGDDTRLDRYSSDDDTTLSDSLERAAEGLQSASVCGPASPASSARGRRRDHIRSPSLISLGSTAAQASAAPETDIVVVDTTTAAATAAAIDVEGGAQEGASAVAVLRGLLDHGGSRQRRPRSSSGAAAFAGGGESGDEEGGHDGGLDGGRHDRPPLSKRLKWRSTSLLRLLPTRAVGGPSHQGGTGA